MAERHKERGASARESDAAIIRRQLVWLGLVLGGLGLAWAGYQWGEDRGWGDTDRAVTRHLKLGDEAMLANRPADALDHYQAVAERWPQHERATQALTQLAQAQQNMGQFDAAMQTFDVLLKRLDGVAEKKDLRAYTLLQTGKLERERGNHDAARKVFARVRTEHPRTDWSGEALSGIGQTWQVEKQYDKARSAYRQLILEAPRGFLAADAQAAIGACYEAEEKPKEALQAYKAVIANYPSAVWDQAKARIEALSKQMDAGKSRAKKS